MKRKIWLIAAVVAAVLAAVIAAVVLGDSGTSVSAPETSGSDPAATASSSAQNTVSSSEETTEDLTGPSYPMVELDVPPIEEEKVEIRVEAEEADYTGVLAVESLRMGYSGEGYLAGFACNPGDSVEAVIEIPAAQHYDLCICVFAESPVTNALLLNGERVGEFTIDQAENFIRVTFSGIYLPQGEITLSIEEIDGGIALDYFEVKEFTEMYEMEYDDAYELSDPDASENAQALMAFLSENYGSKVITGQYVATDSNTELDLIFQQTGKYPAIRFGDLQGYTENSTADEGTTIQACLDWSAKGGIVGLIWHWDAPMGISSVYAEETDFSLASAVTEEEVALLTQEEIDDLLAEGAITEECHMILHDIDSIAEALKPLCDADVPVLWRPLHEASGDWYWWGADGSAAYQWLWELLFNRMTQYHEIHNLIWIWNGQSESYLVDEELYDIASMDIYLSSEEAYSSRYEQYVLLSRMTEGKKLLALSECSSVPDMNDMFRDNCIWSFFGLWYGEYLMDEEGQYSEAYTSADALIAIYNSEAAVTLEECAQVLLDTEVSSEATEQETADSAKE